MALKKDLEKAIDLIGDVQEAKDKKALDKAVENAEKFEKTVQDKALAEKLGAIVDDVVEDSEQQSEEKKVDSEQKSGIVVPVGVKEKGKPRTEEEKKARLNQIPGRVIIPE